eukprot:TRINITY_DN27343_c0_g1_i3.p1 TRINITY_DN27343_c0_g1~~TRINITY_DN27343_c0_g1_i3.p1  ORF type:complete len:469 (-),score=85.31 TRINITY_DN27343_c0_g1_i3:1181-2587(-)
MRSGSKTLSRLQTGKAISALFFWLSHVSARWRRVRWSVSMSAGLVGLVLAQAAVSDGGRSPTYEIGGHLQSCGHPANAEARFVCNMQCEPEDPVLEEALSEWWDARFNLHVFQDMCSKVGWAELCFQAMVLKKQVYYHRCSRSGEKEHEDVDALLDIIGFLAEAADLPDLVFNFNVGDQPFTSGAKWTPVPQFHWVRAQGYWTIPWPSPFHLRALVQDRMGDHHGRLQPWQERIAKVYWRGSFSVPDNTPFDLLRATPRYRLFRLASLRPDLFDVGFTDVDDALGDFFSPAEVERVREMLADGMAEHADFSKTLRNFKYVVNVAAVLSSWRELELLASGALLFLQDSSDADLVRSGLRAWEHFVPVRNDLSDLIEKVEYMVGHDELAQKIAGAAQVIFHEHMTKAQTLCYIWRALRSISNNSDLSHEDLMSLEKNGFRRARPADPTQRRYFHAWMAEQDRKMERVTIA